MVHTPASMISQMCVIDVACYDMLVDVIYKATDNASQVQLNSTSAIGSNSSSSSSSAHNALVEQDLYMEDMAFVIYCWLVIIFGTCLNIFTIVVLLVGQNNSSDMRVQLVNLALADCSMALIEPQTFRGFRLGLEVHPIICSIGGFLQYGTFTLSILCNTAISIDRFIAVFFPLKVQNITNYHKAAVAVTLWLLAIAIDFGCLFNCKTWEILDYKMCFCSAIIYDSSAVTAKTLNIIRFVKNVPAIIIVLMYVLVGIRILEWKRFSPLIAGSASKRRYEKRMKQKVRMPIFVC